MKRLLITALAMVVSLGGHRAVHAHPEYGFAGGCRVTTLSEGGDEGGQHSATAGVVLVVAATDAAGNPAPTVPLSASCELYVNGVFNATIVAADGVGAATNAATFAYSAAPDDIVALCVVADVGEEPHRECHDFSARKGPFDRIIDFLNWVIDGLTLLRDLLQSLNSATCPLGGSMAPGVPGTVDVTPEGDVYLFGELYYDCPPYEV